MATAKRPRRSNRKKSGTINVAASSTISQLPPVPPTSASNSAPLSRRQIMPPAPAPLWMQPTIPPGATTARTTCTTHLFQPLLPYPSSFMSSSQQLAATAAALSSPQPSSTSARAALPLTLSSSSTAPPLAQRQKQHHDHQNRRSHSIKADTARWQLSTKAPAKTARPIPYPPSSTSFAPSPMPLMGQPHPPLSIPLPQQTAASAVDPIRQQMSTSASASAVHSSMPMSSASIAPPAVPLMGHPSSFTQHRKRCFNELDVGTGFESGASMGRNNIPPTNAPQPQSIAKSDAKLNYLYPVRPRDGESIDQKMQRKLGKMLKLGKILDSGIRQKLFDIISPLNMPFFDAFITESGREITPLDKDNRELDGAYLWKNTIGQTGSSFFNRGKKRLEEDKAFKGNPKFEHVQENMSIVFSTKQCMEIVMLPEFKEAFETMKGMRLPLITFDSEKQQDRDELIARLLIECLLSATTNTYTHNVLECFTETPSEDILNITRSPAVNQQCSDVTSRAKKLYDVFSWGTFKSLQYQMIRGETVELHDGRLVSSAERDVLCRLVRPHPTQLFLQKDITQRMRSNNIKVEVNPFIDCVPSKENPRSKEICKVIEDLTNVLTDAIIAGIEEGHMPSDEVIEEVERIVNSISKEDYVAPDDDVLREAATRVLLELSVKFKGKGDDVLIQFERVLYDLLDDETRDKLFPADTTNVYHQLDVDGEEAVTVFQTEDGPNYRLVYSVHVALGEKNKEAARIKSIKRIIASMAEFNRAGILSDEDFRKQKDLWIAFLMRWFGYGGSPGNIKGSFPFARNSILGERMCDPHFAVKGAQMTGNRIGENGISQAAVVMMRTFLRQPRFNAMLTCLGTPTNEGNPSPLDNPDQCEVWAKKRQQQRYHERSEEERERDKEYKRQRYHARSEEECERESEYRRQRYLEFSEEEKNEILEKAKKRRAQVYQKNKHVKADAIRQKARAAYKQYLELRGKNQLISLSRPNLLALLKYIAKIDPKVKYIDGTVEKTRERLGISLSDTNDPLRKYFNPQN